MPTLPIDGKAILPYNGACWANSSTGRALRLHRRGHRFEPCFAHHGTPRGPPRCGRGEGSRERRCLAPRDCIAPGRRREPAQSHAARIAAPHLEEETNIDAEVRKHLYRFIACLVIIALCAVMANVFEHGFGRVAIKKVKVDDGTGNMLAGKLYIPKWASATFSGTSSPCWPFS